MHSYEKRKNPIRNGSIRSLRLRFAICIIVGTAVPGVPESLVVMRNAEDSVPYSQLITLCKLIMSTTQLEQRILHSQLLTQLSTGYCTRRRATNGRPYYQLLTIHYMRTVHNHFNFNTYPINHKKMLDKRSTTGYNKRVLFEPPV